MRKVCRLIYWWRSPLPDPRGDYWNVAILPLFRWSRCGIRILILWWALVSRGMPPEFLSRWQHVSGKMSAHIQACRASKIDLSSYTFLELVPKRLLSEFLEIKNKITEHVLKEYPKPANYDFLYSLERFVGGLGKIGWILICARLSPTWQLSGLDLHISAYRLRSPWSTTIPQNKDRSSHFKERKLSNTDAR